MLFYLILAGLGADRFLVERAQRTIRRRMDVVEALRWPRVGEDCTFAVFAPGLKTLYNRKESFGPEGELSAGSVRSALKPQLAQRV